MSPLLLAQSVVENVKASRDNTDSVIVEWDAVPEASSYEVTYPGNIDYQRIMCR